MSLLILICTVYTFTYICSGAESNGYFYGTHSAGPDEVAHVSLLILICTVYTFTYICPGAESNGSFYGTHGMCSFQNVLPIPLPTVVPTKSDGDAVFCLQLISKTLA